MSSNFRRRRKVSVPGRRRRQSVSRVEVPEPFDPNFLADKAKAERVKDYFKGEAEIGARRKIGELTATSDEFDTSGSIPLLKHGFVNLKTSAGLMSKYKQKFAVLEKGVINIFNPKDVVAGQAVPTVLPPELSLPLADLRAIGYQKRGDTVFALIFGLQTIVERRNEGRSVPGRKKRRRRLASTNSNDRDTLNSSTETMISNRSVYKEKTFYFKLRKGNEAEVWLAAILTEVKNQAKAHEANAIRALRSPSGAETVEGLLRQAVDLYQLSLGKYHKSTALAQDRLSKFLKKDQATIVEGKFWQQAAQTTGKMLKKLEKFPIGKFIVQRTKLVKSDSAINQLQFQTEAIYKMRAYKEKVVSMRSEAQKWKARAILYGYGDRKARQAPLKKLSYTKERVKASQKGLDTELQHAAQRHKSKFAVAHNRVGEDEKSSRPTKKSFTSHITLSTNPESKADIFHKRLPSVLDTDVESEAMDYTTHGYGDEIDVGTNDRDTIDNSTIANNAEFAVSEDRSSKASKEPEKKSFIRPFKYHDDKYNGYETSGTASEPDSHSAEGLWDSRSNYNPDAIDETEGEEKLPERPSRVEGMVEPVVETEVDMEEEEQEVTHELMREYLNTDIDETNAHEYIPDMDEPSKTMLSHHTLEEDNTDVDGENKVASPKEQALLHRLNSFDGPEGPDIVPLSLEVLKNEFEELKTGDRKKTKSEPSLISQAKKKSVFRDIVDKSTEKKPACYLMFSPANKGTLFMRWSKRDISGESLMQFAPLNPKKIASYKYRVKSGLAPARRDELIRNVIGSKRKMFQGVNLFLKEAGKYDASVTIFGNNVNFRLFGYTEADGRIAEIPFDEEIACVPNMYDAVATVPEDGRLFDGLRVGSKAQFISRGRKLGAAIDFQT